MAQCIEMGKWQDEEVGEHIHNINKNSRPQRCSGDGTERREVTMMDRTAEDYMLTRTSYRAAEHENPD